MSDNWQDFLRAQGAHYEGGVVTDFGNAAAERRAARSGNVLVDLSSCTVIRAQGADARTFLDGQLTNALVELDATHSQLSAWCSPKGRMLVVFRVFRQGDAYLLQLPTRLRDDILKRLRMYVLRAKVTLEIVDEEYVRMGIGGPDAARLVQGAAGALPAEVNGVAAAREATILALPGAHPRFEILAAPAAASGLWNSLKASATPAGLDAWVWHDIAVGLPIVLPETSDAFVPQMANLELLGGVSFTKGCYTGQEIVARVHYRGRLKQRMYRAHVKTPETPRPGEAVYAADQPAQSTGTVVIATPDANDGQDLLAVIHCDAVERNDLRLARPDGPRLQILPLPYPLTLPE